MNLLKGKIQHYHQKSSNTEKIIKSATTRKGWIKLSLYSKGMRDKFQIADSLKKKPSTLDYQKKKGPLQQ